MAAIGGSSAHALRKVVADQMSSITELLSNGKPSPSLLARDGPSPTHSRENVEEEVCFLRLQGAGSKPTGSTVS